MLLSKSQKLWKLLSLHNATGRLFSHYDDLFPNEMDNSIEAGVLFLHSSSFTCSKVMFENKASSHL